MKIISDFEDYYDHFQKIYSSNTPSIIYMRKTYDIDMFISMKVQEDLNLCSQNIKSFSDKVINPTWTITPFIVGASGRFNRGVEIRYGDDVDHSYTYTGAVYIPQKMGIPISQDISKMLEKHFEKPVFDQPCIFKTVGTPVFVILFDDIGILRMKANPCLKSFGYPKACMSSEIYLRIKAFIDNFLIPCEDALPYSKSVQRVPRILGLKSSGWALHDGLPKGY